MQIIDYDPNYRKPCVATPRPQALSEAPCSINGRIDVDGRCLQVTGRGLTGAEAAANFRATVDALTPAPAPAPEPATPSHAAQIATMLACGLQKATDAQDWPLVERLAKAAAIVLSGGVELGERAGMVAVHSQAHPDTWYEVEAGHCTCPDGQRHQDRACKHRLAAAMWGRLVD